MLNEILHLDKLISDCLAETLKLKSIVVGLQQYEYAAQIRDLEKQFEAMRSTIATLPYPIIPNKGLTRNGAIYSAQLFSYGHHMGWKNLPHHITNLFVSRKTELNSAMVHSEATTAFFSGLNSKLVNEEARINEFINELHYVYKRNNLDTMVDVFSYGGIVIQFLTSKEFTRTALKEGKTKWKLFEMEVSIEDWVKNRALFYKNIDNNTNNQFLKALPIALRDKNLCYLFYYLGSAGFLALQDMLNIHQIYISFPFLCRLTPV